MAARKVNRAPPPPTLHLQQQQMMPKSEFETQKLGSLISFRAESTSNSKGGGKAVEARMQNGRHSPQLRGGPMNGHHQLVSKGVTDAQESEQQQQQPQQRLKRTSYIPQKSTAPPPPQLQVHLRAQSYPLSYSDSDQEPSKLPAGVQVATPTAEHRVVVHRTVYTQPKDVDDLTMRNPAAADGSNRLINIFAPSSQRPIIQPPKLGSSRASSAGNLSTASWKSTGSQKSYRNSGGGQTVKGRLANLFRRRDRKPEQPLPQKQLKEQQQPQGQQPNRLRRHSCAPQAQMPAVTRKNLHTFTYTDAKIYNPNNANVYMAPPVRGAGGAKKGPAPQPPLATPAAAVDEAAVADAANDAARPQVWWDMRTMGAMHSNYNADVLLVRNPDPMPDYETATTRF